MEKEGIRNIYKLCKILMTSIAICYGLLFLFKFFGVNGGPISKLIPFIAMMATTIIFMKKIDKKSFRDIGLRGNKNIVILSILLSLIATIPMIYTVLKGENLVFESMSFKSIIWIVTYSFIVGFSEEIFIRGYIYSEIKPEKYKIIGSSFIFALFHIISPEFNLMICFMLFIIGIIFASAFYYIKSLWPLIIFHSIWNLFTDITPYYKDVLVSIFVYVIMLISTIIFLKLNLYKNEKKQYNKYNEYNIG